MEIRDAIEADFEEITAIYNGIVLSSTAIYTDQPSTLDQRIAWWKSRTAAGFPVLVADDNGKVAGFASFGEFRPWPGYRFTVEGTMHIAESARRQGVGKLLLDALLDRARAMGKHVMVAGVDSENQASLRFLESSGFERVGELRKVGHKFGRFLTLVFLQYWIASSDDVGAKPLTNLGNNLLG